MNIGFACSIVHNINSEKYSEDEKIEALKMFLEMQTHNGTTKEQIIKAFRWFWNFCVEESEGIKMSDLIDTLIKMLNDGKIPVKFCDKCGQKLDWSGEIV